MEQTTLFRPRRTGKPLLEPKPGWHEDSENTRLFWLLYDNFGAYVPLSIIKRRVSDSKYTQRVSSNRAYLHPQGVDITWNESNDRPAYKMDYIDETTE